MTVPGAQCATAFIGGGSRGIGRAIARALADAGFEVFLAARTAAELDEARDLIQGRGGRCHTCAADLSSPDQAAAAISEAREAMGSLGVLVCCAGAHPETHPVDEYPIDYWRFMLEVNLGSVFYCARAAVPHMKAQRYGRIINISSVAGKLGPPNASGYVAAKHGVVGFTKVLAAELGRHGITANAVCPGFVETRMTAHKDALRKLSLERSPIGRVVEEDEVAALVLYLVGPHGGAMTGQALSVCGGLSM